MTTGSINAAFPFGTNMDQFDVGLLALGANSAQSATGYVITLGSESLVIGGSGLTFDVSGNLSGGTVTSIEDQYQSAVDFDLTGFAISAATLQQWALADANSSLLNALFSGADTLTGGPLADVLRSYGGNDSISGGAGDDTIDGGLGNDTLNGGSGHDVITTGGGADVIIVGLGESSVAAGVSDVITDWNPSDTITFATGPAGAGDYVEMTAADMSSATAAANALIATGATNLVVVSVGADLVVFADSANNNGTADDAVVISGRGLADIGVGNFTLSPSVVPTLPVSGGGSPPPPPPPPPPPSPVPLPAPSPPAPTPPATLGGGSASPSVIGTSGDDRLVATVNTTEIHGGAGNDTIIGTSVRDYLRGDDGNDSLQGGPAFDDINGNKGNDTIDGGAGGNDWLVGGQGDDLITAHNGDNLLYGNLGNDTLIGGTGNDVLRGGQGDDSIVGGSGNDFISGDRGNDTMSGGAGADIFHTFSGAGLDKVLDFHLSEGDRVMVDPGAIYTVSQVGADTVIDMGPGDRMTLVGVQMSTLTPGWIFGG